MIGVRAPKLFESEEAGQFDLQEMVSSERGSLREAPRVELDRPPTAEPAARLDAHHRSLRLAGDDDATGDLRALWIVHRTSRADEHVIVRALLRRPSSAVA
jgi:hypothetical protein